MCKVSPISMEQENTVWWKKEDKVMILFSVKSTVVVVIYLFGYMKRIYIGLALTWLIYNQWGILFPPIIVIYKENNDNKQAKISHTTYSLNFTKGSFQ